MVKRLSPLLMLVVFTVSVILVSGCGPKGPPREILDELEEAKAASEACEARLKRLQSDKVELGREIEMKESQIESLTRERDGLKEQLGM